MSGHQRLCAPVVEYRPPYLVLQKAGIADVVIQFAVSDAAVRGNAFKQGRGKSVFLTGQGRFGLPQRITFLKGLLGPAEQIGLLVIGKGERLRRYEQKYEER